MGLQTSYLQIVLMQANVPEKLATLGTNVCTVLSYVVKPLSISCSSMSVKLMKVDMSIPVDG